MKKHEHSTHCSHDHDIKKISLVLVFISVFLALEVWGHFKTKSLSLLADALHLLVDVSGLIISIITLRLSKKAPNSNMNFGFERYEVIGALVSVFFIWIAVIYLLAESAHKYFYPSEIEGEVFLKIAVVGLVVNLICISILHFGSHKHPEHRANLNMRATYVHVLGDIIQSVGVIAASAIIYFFPKYVIADILCTVLFASLVMISTFYVVRDGIYILAERAPKDIDVNEIKRDILAKENVLKVMDIKCWSVSVNTTCIIAKILVENITIEEYESVLKQIHEYLSIKKGISQVFIQLETKAMNPRAYLFEVEKTANHPVETSIK